MPILKRLVSIARPYAGKLLLVAVLTSTCALAELVEPWVYRAIVNDIAGVFISKHNGLLAARATNQIEENFILQTFRHVLRLPLAYFTARPSGATARQIDQSDQIAPLYTAVTQEVWSELFTATVILAVMVSVNVELSVVVLVALLVYVLVTVHTTRQLETHLEEYYGLRDDVSGRIQEVLD